MDVSGLFFKNIACPPNGEDVLWMGGIFFQLLSQMDDMRFDRSKGNNRFVPDLIEDIVSGNGHIFVFYQVSQQLKFDGSQFNMDSLFAHFMRIEVNFDIGELEIAQSCLVFCVCRRTAFTRAISSLAPKGLVM